MSTGTQIIAICSHTGRLLEQALPLENKSCPTCYERKAQQMVPGEGFLEIEHREQAEDHQRDDFLNGLQLRRRIDLVPDAVGRNREAIFDQSDAPADENDGDECVLVNFRCPYQANVMKTFEPMRSRIGRTLGEISADMEMTSGTGRMLSAAWPETAAW